MADQFMAESHVAIDLESNSAPVKLLLKSFAIAAKPGYQGLQQGGSSQQGMLSLKFRSLPKPINKGIFCDGILVSAYSKIVEDSTTSTAYYLSRCI